MGNLTSIFEPEHPLRSRRTISPRVCKRVAVCLFLALFALDVRAEANGLVFHFDFSKADGQSSLIDATGRVTAQVNRGSFVVQHGGLRIANGAQVFIPANQLPSMTDELTVCAWVMKGYFAGTHPILFKGEHPAPLQFLFSVGGSSPAFVYKNESEQKSWKGISLLGSATAAEQPYTQPNWVVSGSAPQVKTGYWTHLAAVFKQGEIKIFVNGELAVSGTSAKPETLTPNNLPLYIGAERLQGQSLNYHTGNMLVNDLRLYESALTSQAIQSVYEEEKAKYPRTSLVAEGAVEMPPCLDYWRAEFPNYDPQFERKLELTKEFEKALPEDTLSNEVPKPSVKIHNGRLVFQIHGKTEYPILFLPRLVRNNKYETTEVLGAVRDFSAAGLTLIGTGSFDPSFWVEEGRYDWSKVDETCRQLVAANPRASLAVTFFLRPPKWWITRFSAEMEIYLDANGKATSTPVAPLASAKWLQDSTRMVRDLVAHVEASDYANHVYAYIPHGGDAGEWYWPAAFTGGLSGYSPATRRSFQQWLRSKYGDDPTRLQQAWHQKDIAFEQAEVPSPKERQASECFLFREPGQARPSLDFREYLGDTTLVNITETCRAIKEACAGRKLVTIYYGYSMLFAGKGLTLHKSGLLHSRKIFDSKFIDCIATPLDYVNRRGGETGLNINAFNGTARLSNKLLWHENDLRTHFHPAPEYGRTQNLAESLGTIERGFGLSLTQGAGMWWYMIEGNGMFHDESMMRRIAAIKQAADNSLAADCSPAAEVALIFDENSLDRVAANSAGLPFLDQHLWGTYQNAARMGAPFDVYLLSDLLANREMPKYKLYVFLNAYSTDPAARKAIRKCLGKRNAVAVWCYAPGVLKDQEEDGFDIHSMEALTGIRLGMQKEEKTFALTVTDTSSPITRIAGKFKPYTFGPVFSVEDPAARILGTTGGKPSLAVREFEGWRSVYSLMPLTEELLQGLCDYAGVHVYSRSFDVFTANRSYLMLHASTAGSKILTLPLPSTVRDVLTGDLVGENISQFTVRLPSQSTGIYKIERPQPPAKKRHSKSKSPVPS